MTASVLGIADDRALGGSVRVIATRPRSLGVAKAAVDLGMPEERIEVVDRVEDAVSTALLATPPDGQIVITGSLYVVGAARSVLVS